MSEVRKALAHSFLGANTVTLIQFGSTLIIARLLTPEEIGIYSVAAVFIGVSALLRDFGVTNYLVQANELTLQTLRSALGLVMLTTTTLSLLLVLGSAAIADFYRTPTLQPVLVVLALNTLLVPLGAITLTVARRNMRFGALSIVNVFSALISVTVSISLAYLDYGPISLAWGGVAGTIATALMSLRLRTPEIPWLPSLSRLSEIAKFGLASGGANVLAYINVTASDILLGRFLNMEAVGYFNRSLSLTQFVSRGLSSALNPVLLPWLSEIRRQNHHPRLAYTKVVELMTGVMWPIFATIAVLNHEIILVLFGEQWNQSADLVPYICVSASLGAAYGVCSALYNSIGKPSADLIAQSINLPIKIIAIIVFATHGLHAVAQSWPFLAAAGALTHSLLMRRHADIRFIDTAQALKRSFVVALAALVAAYAVTRVADAQWYASTTLILGGIAAGLATTASAVLLKHPLVTEIQRIAKKKLG